MRRLLRILLNALTVLSLLLCLASAGLWVRSHRRWDVLYGFQSGRAGAQSAFVDLKSGGGGVSVAVGFHSPGIIPVGTPGRWHLGTGGRSPVPYAAGTRANSAGFYYH